MIIEFTSIYSSDVWSYALILPSEWSQSAVSKNRSPTISKLIYKLLDSKLLFFNAKLVL